MVNWYTADPHFGHDAIIGLCNRPFRNANRMGTVLLDNLKACVGPQDDLWILGDLAMGPLAKSASALADLFAELPGAHKHLVIGNHDTARTRALPWDTVNPLAEIKDGPDRHLQTLCHYPMLTWNHARRGSLQMFGHVHDNWRGSRNCVNVGVDVWDFRPVTFDDVARRGAALPLNAHWHEVEPGTAMV